jgi:hypothetical protein
VKVSNGLVVAVVLCAALANFAFAGPVVLPAGSTVAGKTIGEWTADWWNWSASVNGNIFTDTTGAKANENQSGPVFFVAGTSSGSPPVSRDFTIPSGKFVLFPLINWIVANGPDPGFASTSEEVGALVDGTVDPAKLVASLDGTDVADLASHRERSPENFTFTVAAANTGGFPPGSYTDANADGYWLMLEPLDAGTHTLHFGGTSKDFVGPDPALTVPSFTIDVTDHVTVQGSTAIPLPSALSAGAPVLAMALLTAAACRFRKPAM